MKQDLFQDVIWTATKFEIGLKIFNVLYNFDVKNNLTLCITKFVIKFLVSLNFSIKDKKFIE